LSQEVSTASFKTLLLVEDEAIIGMSEAAMLREAGYAVVHVLSGEAAIDSIQNPSCHIDLVLMDVDLGPGIDGIEAARRILRLVSLPIVFLSAHGEAESIEKSESVVNYGYIPKSSGRFVLLAAIRRAFKLHAAGLEQRHANLELADTEAHYHVLFNDLSNAVAEEDFSLVKSYIDGLGAIPDYDAYFSSRPEEVRRCVGLVKLVDFNQEYLALNNVTNREEVPDTISPFVPDAVLPIMQKEIVGLAEGNSSVCISFRNCMEGSATEYIRLKLSLVSGHEDDWSSVLVSFTDVTAEVKAEEGLEALLREKELLMRELEHRVKNNLSIVSSLLGMEATQSRDDKARELLLEAQLRIQSISLIYDLLAHASSASTINCKTYVEDLAALLYSSYVRHKEEVSMNVEVENFTIDVKRGVSLGLIINELLTNSFKYAFPERRGRVHLRLGAADDSISLKVEDDGVGAGEGFDWSASAGLGSKLIDMLVEQLRGELRIRPVPGFRAEVRIPREA
jgi:two-component sensor histidine kinase/CheY-like chemotaxis protein